MALEDEGYQVIQAGSAEDGLAAFRRHEVAFLITDYQLPGEFGDWLVRTAREQNLYQRPALMVTAAIRVPTLPEVEVLTKPVDLEHFIAKVRAHAAPAHPPLSASGPALELVLYVGSNPASLRALQAVQRLLRTAPPNCSLRVIRLCDAMAEAERDRVTFAPTLVLKSPQTRAWSVGDAAIERNLDAWLELARATPLAPARM